MKVVNEGQGHLKEYMEGVKFSAVSGKYDNCCCDGCFRTTKVTKIIYPSTKYFVGGKLSTRYHEEWLCADCMGKLKAALENPAEET